MELCRFWTETQLQSCAISNICATFATELSNVIVSMNTVTYKMPCGVLETESQTIKSGQDKRNWTQYSRAIAALMSKRMSELGMTQRMLAEKMNCTQQYISKMLKGQKNMSLETICKIENTLGIEIIKGLNENEQ